jgi:cytidylate kinase
MYRAVAVAVLDGGIPPDDAEGAARIARSATIGVEGERVHLDGRDVSERIRAPEVTQAVSAVAAHPSVRAVLVERQRELIARTDDVVMEGRDIGTTVAPEAEVKVFLTASLEERARRRARQLGLTEDVSTLEQLAVDLHARDDADATRSASPFRMAAGALLIDSTGRSVDDIVEEIAAVVAGEHDVRAT